MKGAEDLGCHKRVMIAVNGSKESGAAVRWAVENVVSKGDYVVLFNVTKTPKKMSPASVSPMLQGSLSSNSSDSLAVLQLVLLQQYCKSKKVDARIETETSEARRAAILDTLVSEEVTHLIMGTGGKGGRTMSMFQKESLTTEVSRRAACSVFLVNARKRLVSYKEGSLKKKDNQRSRPTTSKARSPLPDMVNWEEQESPRVTSPSPTVSEESYEETTPKHRLVSPLLLESKEKTKSPRRVSPPLPIAFKQPPAAKYGRLLLPPSLELKLDCLEYTEDGRPSPSTSSFTFPSPPSTLGASSPASSTCSYPNSLAFTSPRSFRDSPRFPEQSFRDSPRSIEQSIRDAEKLLTGRPTKLISEAGLPTNKSGSPTNKSGSSTSKSGSPTSESGSPTKTTASREGSDDLANDVSLLKEQVAMLTAATEAAKQVLQVSAALAQSAEKDAQDRRRELVLERKMRAAAERKARALSEQLALHT